MSGYVEAIGWFVVAGLAMLGGIVVMWAMLDLLDKVKGRRHDL